MNLDRLFANYQFMRENVFNRDFPSNPKHPGSRKKVNTDTPDNECIWGNRAWLRHDVLINM